MPVRSAALPGPLDLPPPTGSDPPAPWLAPPGRNADMQSARSTSPHRFPNPLASSARAYLNARRTAHCRFQAYLGRTPGRTATSSAARRPPRTSRVPKQRRRAPQCCSKAPNRAEGQGVYGTRVRVRRGALISSAGHPPPAGHFALLTASLTAGLRGRSRKASCSLPRFVPLSTYRVGQPQNRPTMSRGSSARRGACATRVATVSSRVPTSCDSSQSAARSAAAAGRRPSAPRCISGSRGARVGDPDPTV